MRNRSFGFACVVTTVLAAAAPARAQAPAPAHTIVSLPAENFSFLPFYVAQDQHIFEQQGLAVQKVVLAGVATTNGVISGAADFGFSNGASLTRAAARGQKLLGIAIMSDKPVWAILMSKKLADAAHFNPQAPLAERAKIFASAHNFAIDSVNSVGHALTRVIEKIGGVDPESLLVTPLGAPEAIAAFSRSAIDGFVSNPPWSEQILATGTAVIIANSLTGDPPWMTPFGSGVVITRPQFCADHRSICAKIGHSLEQGMAFIHAHPAEALAVLRSHFPQIDPGVLKRSFAVIEKSMPQTPVIVEAAIRNSDRLNIEAGFMKPSEQLGSYADLFTNEFVQ
ncbi:MAG TPA: ABC transporter substrate-binding protein [Stellaceae bacterium]|jgi:ABC-type nitrate/sulfonate/bicarbonate transport system substrate-binding protein